MSNDPTPPTTPPRQAGNDTAVSNNRLGNYRLERRLGVGGMGEVYYATDIHLHRPAAIKLIRHDFAEMPGALDRLKVEAQAAARLHHPNIVTVYQYGEDEGRAYIALEYVEGRDLGKVVSKEGTMAPERALRLIRQAATALRYAADNKIIHRDIKPSNILLMAGDVVKVSDFGLAKIVDSDNNLTRTDMVIGSPNYMSPEQGLAQPVDFRADMYSLGCTLYALMMGEAPYDATTPLAIMVHHASSPIPEPERLRGVMGGRLMALLKKMLAKKAADRHATYDALIGDIDALLATAPPPSRSHQGLKVAAYILVPAAMLVAASVATSWLLQHGEQELDPATAPPPTPVAVAANASAPLPSVIAGPATPAASPAPPAPTPTPLAVFAAATPSSTPTTVPFAAPRPVSPEALDALRGLPRGNELARRIWERQWDAARSLGQDLEDSEEVNSAQSMTVAKIVDGIDLAEEIEALLFEYSEDEVPFELDLTAGPVRIVEVLGEGFVLESPPGATRVSGNYAQLARRDQFLLTEWMFEDEYGNRIEDALGRALYLHLLEPDSGEQFFDEMKTLPDFADREADLRKRWELWKAVVAAGRRQAASAPSTEIVPPPGGRNPP